MTARNGLKLNFMACSTKEKTCLKICVFFLLMYVLIFYIIILMLCCVICFYRKPQVMGKKIKGSGAQSEPLAKKPKEDF